MTDVFLDHEKKLNSPANKSELVDISSTDHVFTNLPRGLWIGSAGNVKVTLSGDSTGITLNGISAGSLVPVRPMKIFKTGTTVPSTDLIGLY